jgi:hypothetical protein
MDYIEILRSIYRPDVGSIWKAPNFIWQTGFARNIDGDSFHPAIVERIKADNFSVQLAPGTSVNYNKGSCVYKIDLANDGIITSFLLKLSMPYTINSLLDLERGWNGVDQLDEIRLKEFEWQIKICKG